MIDFEHELNEMISGKNLMNSYKLYFLKTLIVNTSSAKKEFTFREMACWMCAYSFSDVCRLGGRIRPLDKLYDAAVLIIENEGLIESSKLSEVYSAIENTENVELKKLRSSLCNYVPYRLLAYMWPQELKGKTDKQKNVLIEEFSRSEDNCLYAIYSISRRNKTIEMNPLWISYIIAHRERLITWIDQKIYAFVRRSVE